MTTTPSSPVCTKSSFAPPRVTYSPSSWRLGLRNGELILQSGSCWVQGSEGGVEWSDVPTVNP